MKEYRIIIERWDDDSLEHGETHDIESYVRDNLRDTVADLMQCGHPFEWPTVETIEDGLLVVHPEDDDGVREYRTLHLPDISISSVRRIARLLGVHN